MDNPVYISGYFESSDDIVLSNLHKAMKSAYMPILMTSRESGKTRVYFENCGYSTFHFCQKAIEWVAETVGPYMAPVFPITCKGTWQTENGNHGTFFFDGMETEFIKS